MRRNTIKWNDRDAITWEPGTEYAKANGGWGMCNTGSGKPVTCCLNGIGCDVDHVAMMMRQKPVDG